MSASTIQSIGSPMYWREVTRRLLTTRMIIVAWKQVDM